MEFKKNYSASKPVEQQSFISLSLEEETPKQMTWEVKVLQLQIPDGDSIEIKSNNEMGNARQIPADKWNQMEVWGVSNWVQDESCGVMPIYY